MKTSTSTGKRSMKPNLQARIDEIAFDLSNGLSRNEIVRKIEKKYNIKSDQVDKYIRKAKDQAERQRQDNKTAVVNNYHLKEIEARIEALISKEQIIKGLTQIFFNEGDNIKPSDQISAAKQISVMMGWNAPQKSALTNADGSELTLLEQLARNSAKINFIKVE
jgi:hypothetical protein